MTGFLLLEDGTSFPGRSVGADGIALGEAVFTTAMLSPIRASPSSSSVSRRR